MAVEEAAVVALTALDVARVVVAAAVKEEGAEAVAYPSRAYPSGAAEAEAEAASSSRTQHQLQIHPLAAEEEAAVGAAVGAKIRARAEQHQVEERPSPQLHLRLRSLRTWYWESVGRRFFARTFATDSTLPASSRRDFRGVPAALQRCLSRHPRNQSSS